MRPFTFLIKLTTIGRAAIISFFFNFGCTFFGSLEEAFSDSARYPAEPHSWQANRRYYLLIQFFQKKGYLRCVAFRKDKGCEGLPRVREIRLMGQVQNAKRGYVGRVLVAEANLENPFVFLDFTTEKGVESAKVLEKFFKCLYIKNLPLSYMPNIIFYEGDEFLPYVEKNFTNKISQLNAEKSLCK